MPEVLIILGSKSDLPIGRRAMETFDAFEVKAEMVVASAHRTPRRVEDLVTSSDAKVFIAVAGLAAALPGSVAAVTVRPVIGVPVSGKLNIDSILSMVQMPPGIPVGAVGLDRGENAALLALQILAISDEGLTIRLKDYREELARDIIRDSAEVN